MTEHDAYSAARVDMNIQKECRDQPLVVLGHSFRDAKEVKVRIALYVQVDCNGIDSAITTPPMQKVKRFLKNCAGKALSDL